MKSQKKKESFKEHVERVMKEVVKQHQHNHPLYKKTHIVKSIIDEKNKRAAFVLFEQIDTDKCTPEGRGWLGDQFRYSVWYIKGMEPAKQLYEDHSYYGGNLSQGRDPTIGLEELLEDGVIVTITPKDATHAYGDLSQIKVKITLEGKMEEPEDFMEQARNLIKRIGHKLGYDYLSQEKQLPGKNIAAIVWAAENGSTYGFDTVYLVWKDKKGEIQYKEITNSRSTKAYLQVDAIREDDKNIIVEVKGNTYKISKAELNLK